MGPAASVMPARNDRSALPVARILWSEYSRELVVGFQPFDIHGKTAGRVLGFAPQKIQELVSITHWKCLAIGTKHAEDNGLVLTASPFNYTPLARALHTYECVGTPIDR